MVEPATLKSKMSLGDSLTAGESLGKRAKGLLKKVFHADQESEERTIAGKTFRLNEGIWVDTAHTKQAILIRIQRDSEAYRALLQAIPQLAVYVDAEDRILVNVGRCSIEIAPDGNTALTAEDLRQLVESWNAAHSSR